MTLVEQLVSALQDALPTLEREARDEDITNLRKKAAGYPASSHAHTVLANSKAALDRAKGGS